MEKILKKTKIVCTLGPASSDKETIIKLINNGMNVARINFSHSSPEKSKGLIKLLKEIREELEVPLSIMLDTKGPEVRLYGYENPIPIKKDYIITIKSYLKNDIETIKSEEKNVVFTNLPDIGKLVNIGKKVLLMDGFIEGTIIEKNEQENFIKVKIFNNGDLRKRAHLTLPHIDYPLPFLSEKDKRDIKFAVENDLEYIALSFVKSADDLYQVRELIIDTKKDSKIKLISKIENKKAIDNMDDIIEHSDGIMVARGDLGVELDLEEVPIIQKKLISKCYLSGKPVITATQMLESMIENPIPTRAETSDVANAVFDKTSAVMLSGETAIGKYPDLVVNTMSRIIKKVEESLNYIDFLYRRRSLKEKKEITSIISFNALSTAYQSDAKAIAVFTKSGYTARMISRLRPGLPLYVFTYDKFVYNQLALNWGIIPFLIEKENNFEKLIQNIKDFFEKKNLLNKGELVVFVAGLPLGKTGTTNMIRLETIGKARIIGKSLNSISSKGQVIKIDNMNDIKNKNIYKKVIILNDFQDSFIPYLKYAAGIITESENYDADLKVLSLAYNIPIITGTIGVNDILDEGSFVEINGKEGMIIEI